MKINFTNKRKFSVFSLFALFALSFLLIVSCANGSDSSDDSPDKPDVPENPDELIKNHVFTSRSQGLDFIYNVDQLGETKLKVSRAEWKKMLGYYDLNKKNETYIHADYSFQKKNYLWEVKDVGLRIRGNTSRCRPQEKVDETKDGKYCQAHFKVDFEEWPAIVDGVETERDEKMGGVMKGVILKRFKDDYTYSREVFSYNYFRDCGVWTAPRASYTRLLIDIVEDDGSVEKVDYGIYEMIENTDKQFLKARTKEENGDLNGNKGNLWKCTWKTNAPDLSLSCNTSDFGVEKVELDDSLSQRFSYDLKTNKDKLDKCASDFMTWITNLNNLDNYSSSDIKTWYDNNIDTDLFLKTYAINVILGMWDDYWIDNNNYYFYFDKDGKAYFIPYDYDNSLGTNGIGIDSGTHDPVAWGQSDGKHPLIEKILLVPEYLKKYKEYLLKYSDSSSNFDFSKASEKIKNWQKMIKPYIGANKYSECKIAWEDTSSEFQDVPASWGDPYVPYTLYTDGENNYFKVRQNAIKSSIKEIKKLKLTLNNPDGHIFIVKDTGNISADGYVIEFDEGEFYTTVINTIYIDIESHPENKQFLGWGKDGNVFVNQRLYEDVELDAVWKKTYEVTFKFDVGTYTPNESMKELKFRLYEGCRITNPVLDIPGFSLSDHTLIGWGDDGRENLVYEVTSDMTVYPFWRKDEDLPVFKYDSSNNIFNVTFRPSDYNMNYSGDVYIRCNGSGWADSESYKMIYDSSSKSYTLTVSNNSECDKFKFSTTENEWMGINELIYELPSKYYDDDGNFLLFAE